MNPTWLYVAAIYSIAIWLARRAGLVIPTRIGFLFYGLTLGFLFQPMTGPYVSFPADFVQSLTPWAHLKKGPHAGNFQLNDLTMQIVPWAHQVRESWKSLEVPLWNASAGAGYPLLANAQSSALSPIRLLALPLPLGYAITAEAAMKLLTALTFTYLYCKRRGYSDLASCTGAAAFSFGTFMTTWLHFPLATAASMLPVTLFAVDLLVERITYFRFLFAALVWVTILFSGHPETAAHIFFLALLSLVWILGVERSLDRRGALRLVLVLGAALTVAAILAAPFLATFGEALTKSKRYNEMQVNPPEENPFTDFPSAVLLFQPHFYGQMPHDVVWGPVHPETITGFTGVLGFAAVIALLIRALLTRRLRTRETFYVAASFVILGVLLDWPVIGWLFHKVLFLAANLRLRLLFGFMLALATAAAIHMLAQAAGRTRREAFLEIHLPWLIGLICVATALYGLLDSRYFDILWHLHNSVLEVFPSIVVVAVAALAVIAGKARPLALMLLMVAIVAEVWATGIEWNAPVHEDHVYPTTPLIEKLQELHEKTPKSEPFRIVGIGPMIFPNANAVYGFEDIRAHDPMSNSRYLGLLRMFGRYDPSDYFAQWWNADAHILNLLNVRYVVVSPEFEIDQPHRFSLVYKGRDGAIYENREALPRFYWSPVVLLEFNKEYFIRALGAAKDWYSTSILDWLPVENDQNRSDLLSPRPANAAPATVKIVEASASRYRLRVDAPRYSLVSSSIAYWPGWRVTANGRPLNPLQVNGAFLGFVVRPGVNDVEVRYAPATFRYGAIASLLTAAILAALSRESLRRRLSVRAARG